MKIRRTQHIEQRQNFADVSSEAEAEQSLLSGHYSGRHTAAALYGVAGRYYQTNDGDLDLEMM